MFSLDYMGPSGQRTRTRVYREEQIRAPGVRKSRCRVASAVERSTSCACVSGGEPSPLELSDQLGASSGETRQWDWRWWRRCLLPQFHEPRCLVRLPFARTSVVRPLLQIEPPG